MSLEYRACPCCSGKKLGTRGRAHVCKACGAVFGVMGLEESYRIVTPKFQDFAALPGGAESVCREQRYYDFTCIADTGAIERRHGWFLPRTRCIVQVG